MPMLVKVMLPSCIHRPAGAKPPLPASTANDAESPSADPVSPWMVTVDPGSRSQLALIDTVMVLTTAAKGEFCSTVLTSIEGTSTSRGL